RLRREELETERRAVRPQDVLDVHEPASGGSFASCDEPLPRIVANRGPVAKGAMGRVHQWTGTGKDQVPRSSAGRGPSRTGGHDPFAPAASVSRTVLGGPEARGTCLPARQEPRPPEQIRGAFDASLPRI